MNNLGSFGSFDAGSALSSLKQARNTELATDFNELTTGISQKTTNLEDIYGAVQKGGASVVGTGALLKGAYTSFKKWKANKGKKEEGDEEDGEEADEATGNEDDLQGQMDQVFGTEAEQNTVPDWMRPAFEGGEQPADDGSIIRGTGTGVEEEAEDDTEILGRNTFNVNAGSDTGNASGNLLERTDATRDVPEVAEDAEEDVEETGENITDSLTDTLSNVADGATDAITNTVNTVGSTVGDALSSITSSASNAVSNASSSIGNAISSLTSNASNAVSGTVDATTGLVDGAEITGEAVAGTVAGGAEELAGSALDASVIGIPLGVIMNIIGGITIAGSIGAGLAGDISAGNDEANEMNEAQQNYKTQLQGAIPNIQGKYSV